MVDSDLIRHEGNEDLFFAIEISVVSALAGSPLHFHVEGVRGTGKTTILRASRGQLPPIERIAGCVYHCRRESPHCPEHRAVDDLDTLPGETLAMPFLEISHAAKLGTVVGSIDLSRLTHHAHPEAALLPGTVPQANRGILLVDEINRLAETAPDLADVLLSAMGTKPGRIQIEETGLPVVELPVEVSVWAASNPDEEPGPLEDVRRQLADRFDLVVPVQRPHDLEAVRKILVKASRFAQSPGGTLPKTSALRRAAQRLRAVRLSEQMEELIAGIYLDYRLESLRAVEAMAHTARLAAVVRGADEVKMKDLIRVAPLVLRHRVDAAVLNQILRELTSRQAAGTAAPVPPAGDGDQGEELPVASGKERGSEPVENKTKGEGNDDDSSWHKIVSRLRGLITSHDASHETTRSRAGNGHGPRAGEFTAQDGQSPSSSQEKSGSPLADPAQIAVEAPPLPGRPLVSLPLAELVQRGEMMGQ